MNQQEVIAHIQGRTLEPNQGWWIKAAYSAILGSAYNMITPTGSDDVYLARFWLTVPQFTKDHNYDSGNSVLLHFILKDDEDDAMHDHPWDFRTHILSGGYTEQLPNQDWDDEYYSGEIDYYAFPGPLPGPHPPRRVGNIIQHKATDLHKAVEVMPDTWTLVTTGSKDRDWGFWPEGQPWAPYKDHLGISYKKEETEV